MYTRELNKILDEIFNSTDDTLVAMSIKSSLCYSTVLKLNDRTTKCPHFRTVWKLAKAYGFGLQLVTVQKMRRAS